MTSREDIRAYSTVDMGHFLEAGIQNVELETEICGVGDFTGTNTKIIDLTTNQE